MIDFEPQDFEFRVNRTGNVPQDRNGDNVFAAEDFHGEVVDDAAVDQLLFSDHVRHDDAGNADRRPYGIDDRPARENAFFSGGNVRRNDFQRNFRVFHFRVSKYGFQEFAYFVAFEESFLHVEIDQLDVFDFRAYGPHFPGRFPECVERRDYRSHARSGDFFRAEPVFFQVPYDADMGESSRGSSAEREGKMRWCHFFGVISRVLYLDFQKIKLSGDLLCPSEIPIIFPQWRQWGLLGNLRMENTGTLPFRCRVDPQVIPWEFLGFSRDSEGNIDVP